MYIPLLSFSQQRDGSGKLAGGLRHDPGSNSARFSALIDEFDDSGGAVGEMDSAPDADADAADAAAAAQPARPPSVVARQQTPETSADIQLRSLLRDEFIIRRVRDVFARAGHTHTHTHTFNGPLSGTTPAGEPVRER